jgi:hypothetical protein
MTTDIAINGTIASVLPVDVHIRGHLKETILNNIEVTANSIKIVW